MKELEGNILSVQEGIIVHGCNCRGVMGAGIARQIRDKWPDVYSAYSSHRAKAGLRLGDVVAVGGKGLFERKAAARHLNTVSHQLPDGLIVVNAMTQYDFGNDKTVVYADAEAIYAAFARIRVIARDSGLPVHFPQIGCGLANGKWEHVAPIIRNALGKSVDATVWTLPRTASPDLDLPEQGLFT